MPRKSEAAKALAAEPPGTEWLSIKQVAERYQISAETVRRWISYGWVRARRFGPKLIRVDAASVENMGEPIVPTESAAQDRTQGGKRAEPEARQSRPARPTASEGEPPSAQQP